MEAPKHYDESCVSGPRDVLAELTAQLLEDRKEPLLEWIVTRRRTLSYVLAPETLGIQLCFEEILR